jgi:hypothetical protein
MAETGQTGEISPPNVVYWTVDPALHGGVIAIATRQLHSTLLHEFHHLVRESSTTGSGSLMDRAIDEGLATAFERDFGAYALGSVAARLFTHHLDVPSPRWEALDWLQSWDVSRGPGDTRDRTIRIRPGVGLN